MSSVLYTQNWGWETWAVLATLLLSLTAPGEAKQEAGDNQVSSTNKRSFSDTS